MTDSVHFSEHPDPSYFPRLIRDCWHTLPLAAKVLLLVAFYVTMVYAAVSSTAFVVFFVKRWWERRRRRWPMARNGRSTRPAS